MLGYLKIHIKEELKLKRPKSVVVLQVLNLRSEFLHVCVASIKPPMPYIPV